MSDAVADEGPMQSRPDAMGPEQLRHLRRAKRLEWITLAWIGGTVVLVGLVAGQSQAMRAAWAEDALSLLPPLAFLVAARRIRREPSREHPYGHHRSIGVAHLVAAIALLTMSIYLIISSARSLITVERPPLGIVVLLGQPVWTGYLMIAVMAVTSAGPVVLGRMKLSLAEQLHDKVLRADADMGKADWTTAIATIAGVIGIGVGWWWADSAAALLVSVSILSDGLSALCSALAGLTDAQARTVDDAHPHPLARRIEQRARERPWVADAVARVRDEGHVLHAELFVVPTAEVADLDALGQLRSDAEQLDWKLHDVVIVPVPDIPSAQAFRHEDDAARPDPTASAGPAERRP